MMDVRSSQLAADLTVESAPQTKHWELPLRDMRTSQALHFFLVDCRPNNHFTNQRKIL